MAADWAGVPHGEPRDDAVSVVQVLAGHFPGLHPELERVLADRAVQLRSGVVRPDLDPGQRLDRGLRCGWVLGPPEASDLQLRELLQQAIESRPHEEVRHGGRQRLEPAAVAVVVVKLKGVALAIAVGSRPSEDDDRVVGRPFTAGWVEAAPAPEVSGAVGVRGGVADTQHGHGRGREPGVRAGAIRQGYRGGDGVGGGLFDEAGVAVWARDGVVLGPDANESGALVAPVRSR